MTRRPTTSVLIPAFNHAAYIGDAVASALDDGGDTVEVVIVDDGSTDDTPKVLESFNRDPRVHLHRQENRGAHAALNRLLEMARGATCFILNSDDAFEPGRIDALTDYLDHNERDVVACSFINLIDGDGAPIGLKHAWRDLPPWPPASGPPHLNDLDDPGLALLQSNWAATTSNVAFRRSLVGTGLRFLPLRYTHDWDFLLGAASMGGIGLIESPLVRYRVHQANTILEGADDRRAAMQFEILWTVARHAAVAHRRADSTGNHPGDLGRRILRSLPTFDREDLLHQLLALRGTTPVPPARYDALLAVDHPIRMAMIRALGGNSSSERHR